MVGDKVHLGVNIYSILPIFIYTDGMSGKYVYDRPPYLTKSPTLFQYVGYIFNQELSRVPEHDEGKSNKKTEGSSEFRD